MGVIFGPAKIGKTSLLWTLDPETTLFLDLEAGGPSVRGWGGDSLKIRDWRRLRGRGCFPRRGQTPPCVRTSRIVRLITIMCWAV